jgi:ABC-2 type transport system permease protein
MGGKLLPFLGAYLKVNLAMALEYRISLLAQICGMVMNDLLWVAFWVLYFTKFPILKGWTLEDVAVLWASFAFSVGIVFGFFANALRIPRLVVQGQLDYYLALPKDVLLHLLVSQVRLVNFGDVLFAPLLLFTMVQMTWSKFAVFLAATLLGGVVLISFCILIGSLTFYMGNSETVSGQLLFGIMHFATYPTTIFETGVKVLLFTILPAGFITTIPVELVRAFEWAGFLQLLGAAAFFLTAAIWVFRRGLRRYESGSLMMMRS